MFRDDASYDMIDEYELAMDLDTEQSGLEDAAEKLSHNFMITWKDMSRTASQSLQALAEWVRGYIRDMMEPDSASAKTLIQEIRKELEDNENINEKVFVSHLEEAA